MTRTTIVLVAALVLLLLPSFLDRSQPDQLGSGSRLPSGPEQVASPSPGEARLDPLGPDFLTYISASKPRPKPSRPRVVLGTGACGGDLPPCWVLARESGGNLNAYNADGCYHADDGSRGCYGKWQCDPRTCDGTGSEAEQDAEARRVWAGGAGCSHWAAC